MSIHHVYQRLAVLTEGSLDIFRNKTAMNLLRFRPQDVVCVVDTKHAGGDLEKLTGTGAGIPIVASAAEAVRMQAQWLVIGVATPGGFLPPSLRPHVYEAIRNRIGVISGLHESVDGDPNLATLAARHAVELVNLRKVGEEHSISTGKARKVKALRLLTVGTDTNIGKTTTTLSLARHLKAMKVPARMVATGQDGILITGRGLCIDRVISDFCGGAVEKLILHEAKGVDLLVIEGQNSILSPCYSGSALSLLHGSCPDAMILCHAPARTEMRHTDVPIPPLSTFIALYEALLKPLHPGKVVSIALNTLGMEPEHAAKVAAAAARETGLPVADPVRDGEAGCARLLAPVLAMAKARKEARSTGRFKKAKAT
jgi:uncharacterized NAD-dependent epimerase/dehydratase family protein